MLQVGTAHGVSLESLLKNPELNSLVGGVHQVILGDEEAKKTNGGWVQDAMLCKVLPIGCD